jgi:methyl-accepting chemotaxis protein
MLKNKKYLYILMLTKILIIFFLFLILYQIFLAIFGNLIEGLENEDSSYKEYDTNDPNNAMILAQQNAGNISVLKQRIDELMDLKGTVTDVCGNVVQLNQQVQGLVQQQADQANTISKDMPLPDN